MLPQGPNDKGGEVKTKVNRSMEESLHIQKELMLNGNYCDHSGAGRAISPGLTAPTLYVS
jgi:hypothetical protein